MRIDAWASWRHMADHLAPIWEALPPEHRGTFYAPRDVVAERIWTAVEDRLISVPAHMAETTP